MQTIGDHPDIVRIERTGYLYDSKLFGICEECEFEISEGYEMYEYEGETLCEECMDKKLEELKRECLAEVCR